MQRGKRVRMRNACCILFALALWLPVHAGSQTATPMSATSEAMGNGLQPRPMPQNIDDITGTVSLLKVEKFRLPGSTMQFTLQEAIDVAMEQNPQVRIAEHSLQQDWANLDVAESDYRDKYAITARFDETLRERGGGQFRFDPNLGLVRDTFTNRDNNELISVGPTYRRTFTNGSNLTVSPQFQYERDTQGGFNQTTANPLGVNAEDRYSFDVQYDFPINSRPRKQIQSRIENAKLSTIQADYSLFMRKKQISENVINSYWNIKRLQETVNITNERLLQARKIEFTLQVQFENESAALVNVQQAQIDVMNNEASLIEQEGSLRSSIENFNLVLGIPVETNVVLTETLDVTPLPMSSEEYVQLVTSTNLQLKSLQLSIQQTLNSLGVTSLGQQPDLPLSTFFNRSSRGTQNIGAGVFFSFPFGDGGATKARVRALSENLEQLRINLWDLERQLVQESYQDLRDLQLQDQRLEILERNVKQSETTLENALIMFREFGRITFRDMQDFQIDLTRSRLDLVQAKVSYNFSKSNLLQKVHDYSPSENVDSLLPAIH